MKKYFESRNLMKNRGVGLFLLVIGLTLFSFFIITDTALAQNEQHHQHGVNGFLDEDGDGFNDLIPDSDGDGVPNPIDPDHNMLNGDSLGHRNMYGGQDSIGGMHREMMGPGYMYMGHGEMGMYGPGDSSMHGGMMPDSGGHHGGGGMGGGGGMEPPDSGHGGGGMGGGMGGPGPERADPGKDSKNIRSIDTPENREAKLAEPLREIFEEKGNK